MILTILISAILSVIITFSILYYLGKKKSEEIRKQQHEESLELPEGFEDILKQLEKSLGANIQFEEVTDDDFLELEKNKDNKKIYH